METRGLSTKSKHLIISIFTFGVLFALVFSFSVITKSITSYPGQYFGIELNPDLLNISIIQILLIILSVFASYILYLLLTAKTRTELATDIKTKSLYSSLDQLHKIYEESPIPYMTLDKEGQILDVNKATLRFFGATSVEIEKKNIFGFGPEEDNENAEKLLQYYKSKVAINKEEVRMITKEGKVRWVLLSVFRMERPKTDHAGLAALVDITEQKELDQAKTEFVSLASHQLRTPSATIKWYTDILLKGDFGELNEKQKDYLVRIAKVNQNMIELEENLLNISRTEIGSMPVDKKETNVPAIVEDVVFELAGEMEKKNISLEKNYKNELASVETDPKILRIAIQNLISNAIKYTREGGQIMVTLKDSLGEKSIAISDNGMGIPDNDKDKIFTKMFRAENVKKESGEQGTGLGLYLVKSMLEAMDASISFESELNKGSSFIIKL